MTSIAEAMRSTEEAIIPRAKALPEWARWRVTTSTLLQVRWRSITARHKRTAFNWGNLRTQDSKITTRSPAKTSSFSTDLRRWLTHASRWSALAAISWFQPSCFTSISLSQTLKTSTLIIWRVKKKLIPLWKSCLSSERKLKHDYVRIQALSWLASPLTREANLLEEKCHSLTRSFNLVPIWTNQPSTMKASSNKTSDRSILTPSIL